jgi:hypothetical protein
MRADHGIVSIYLESAIPDNNIDISTGIPPGNGIEITIQREVTVPGNFAFVGLLKDVRGIG